MLSGRSEFTLFIQRRVTVAGFALLFVLGTAFGCSSKDEKDEKEDDPPLFQRIEATDNKILGAAIEIPLGAYASPEAITIREGTAIAADTLVPKTEPVTALGPPVQFGPAGATFNDNATVYVPISLDSLNQAFFSGSGAESKNVHLAVLAKEDDVDTVGFVVGPINLVGFVVGPINSNDLIGFVVGPINAEKGPNGTTEGAMSVSANKAGGDYELLVSFDVKHFTTYQVVAVACDGPKTPGKSAKGTEIPDAYCCIPQCVDGACGKDDGCGGKCECGEGEKCNQKNQCEPLCVPECTGKACGNDGCGGTCGECDENLACTGDFQCVKCAQWLTVSAGDVSTGAIFGNGMWTWGGNKQGQLGREDVPIHVANPPALILDEKFTVSAVAFGKQHACAVVNGNNLVCWGDHIAGKGQTAPVVIEHPQADLERSFQKVAVGVSHTCAIDSELGLYCWGTNDRGQLGVGEAASAKTPTAVVAAAMAGDVRWESVTAGDSYTCAITKNDALYCWGDNTVKQLGHGPLTGKVAKTPIRVNNASKDNWKMVAAGFSHTCAITSGTCESRDNKGCSPEGTLFCWGGNGLGQLGIASEQAIAQPTIVEGENWISVTAGVMHTCGIRKGLANPGGTPAFPPGRLYCWGHNGSGELGSGIGVSSNKPVPVGNDSSWIIVSAGSAHTCGIKSDGYTDYLECWGANDYGQLGDCLQSAGCPSTNQGVTLCPCTDGCDDAKVCDGATGECSVMLTENAPCLPDCVDKECGDDGCEGHCDNNPMQGICTANDQAANCINCALEPEAFGCKDKEVEYAWVLTQCNGPQNCAKLADKKPFCCEVDCTGKQCGDNGCGGSCGQCPGNQQCNEDTNTCIGAN